MRALSMTCEITFGKHEGKLVKEVLADEPDYLRWLMESTQHELDDEVIEALEKREAGNWWGH